MKRTTVTHVKSVIGGELVAIVEFGTNGVNYFTNRVGNEREKKYRARREWPFVILASPALIPDD